MRVVVALGGNAISPRDARGEIAEQRATIRTACEVLAELAADGHEIVITHGNGPQIGSLMLKDEAFRGLPHAPLDVLVAESQAQIGYLIQQEMRLALQRYGVPRDVVTLLTQVVVDADDPAFAAPSKPVGAFLDAAGAEQLRVRGIPVGEAPSGGYRRLVPSPAPREIVEAEVICAVLDARVVPIVAGGGGIAVVRDGQALRGMPAVIDKDLTAAVLVRAVRADMLLILTDIDAVHADFGTPNARALTQLSTARARGLLDAGAFATGSMAEKVLAAVLVVESGARAVIAGLGAARAALRGSSGTEIVPDAVR